MPEAGSENEIFSSLSNPLRLQILQELQETPLRIVKLASKVGVTIQAIQRHVEKLVTSGMILKDSDGFLTISPIGEVILLQIPSFLFLSKYRQCFQNHTFLGIPEKMIKRIGELEGCDFLEDAMHGFQHAKRFVESCEKFCYGITSVQPMEFYFTAEELIKNGVRFHFIFPQGMVVPKGYNEARKNTGWLENIKVGKVQEKIVKEAPFMVGISEKSAMLMFANKKTGEIDSGGLFHSDKPKFREWCLDLFNYYWNEVEPLDSTNFKEV